VIENLLQSESHSPKEHKPLRRKGGQLRVAHVTDVEPFKESVTSCENPRTSKLERLSLMIGAKDDRDISACSQQELLTAARVLVEELGDIVCLHILVSTPPQPRRNLLIHDKP
jgi:hypothetical protein